MHVCVRCAHVGIYYWSWDYSTSFGRKVHFIQFLLFFTGLIDFRVIIDDIVLYIDNTVWCKF
jgi:hypothetical protein